ncbi:MAG: SBBP repeat-containing protein [Planctomycetes bacterium]|nr:SBBP repeat-containing protein [Planctomycetota bacterium]
MLAPLLLLSWALQQPVVAPNSVLTERNISMPEQVQRVAPTPSIIENHGQYSDAAQFAVAARDRSVYFSSKGVQIVLSDGQHFELSFDSAAEQLSWSGRSASPTTHNYCSGEVENWIMNVPSWQSIQTPLSPGIDLVFEMQGTRLKYAFHVAPGVSADELLVHYPNSDSLELGNDGSLLVHRGGSQIEDQAPIAWQIAADPTNSGNGETQQAVAVEFELATAEKAVRLKVGDFDATRTLIVDPEMMLLCGFIGGALEEQCRGIDVDSAGNIFVAGFAESTDMPVVNAAQGTFGGGSMDVWVAKITPTNTIAFLTYLGGGSKDLPYDCTVDQYGSVYIVGGTSSGNFPYLNGPDKGNKGSLDCFVTKLDNTGYPIYSGTFGGTEFDSLRGNNVDADGHLYCIGRSFTVDGSFPIVGGPKTSHSGGISDAIVAKISPDGSTLMFSGFIGGEAIDYGRDIIADSDGNVYACGWTNSDETTFPTAVGPDLTHNGGAKDYGLGWEQYGDAWVAKFTGDGLTFIYSGFIGGARADAAFGLALDEQNRLITAGHTTSDENTFPVAVGPDLTFNGNANPDLNPYGDAWVARVKADGTGLDYCGYVGGEGSDRAWRMNRGSIDGAIYLVGISSSNRKTLPHLDAGARSYRSAQNDGVLFRIDPEGRWVDYTTMFAGEGLEVVRDVAVGPDNRVHVTGWSESGIEFPQITPGWTFQGGTDAFIATLPPFYQLMRSGNLWPDEVTQQRPTLLKVNGSAGSNYLHEVHAIAGLPLSISVDSPGGNSEFFALYMIPREATSDDIYHIEYSEIQFGTSTFPMPWVMSTDPQLVTLVNGTGLWYFGTPTIPGGFTAPSNFTWTPPSSGSYTLQAIIADDDKPTGYSITNAVVIRAH